MKSFMHHSQSGSLFIEAAVVMPFLIFLIVAVMQFGLIFGMLGSLRSASAVAARAAILGTGQSNSQVCAAALNSLPGAFNPTSLVCETSPFILPAAPNSPVTITLSYPIPVLTSTSSLFPGPTITLSAQTTMQ